MHRVGIVGLGQIAEGYGSPESSTSYCHAGGILNSNKVELVAVADLSDDRRKAFSDKWGKAFPDVKYFNSADEMFSIAKLDIVAIFVRGPSHHQIAMSALSASSAASLFLEKPPTCSLEEMDTLRSAAKEKKIPITVSYSRHWSPHVLRMQELVADGLIGDVEAIVSYGGGGFLSYACHGTDLICQFAGSYPKTVIATAHLRDEAPEGYEREPVLDGMIIEFENGVVGQQTGHNGEHGGFYCEVVGRRGRCIVGMYLRPTGKDHKNRPLDLESEMPRDRSVFSVAYEQISTHLDGGPVPHCTDEAFAAIHEIGFAGIESWHTGQKTHLPVANRSRRIFANG